MSEETGFNPETYTHVLPEGQEDFQDFTEADLQQNPELGYTDEQVEAEVEKMTEEEKSLYSQIKDFTDTFYPQHGYIIPLGDIVRLYMTGRYPEIPTSTAEEQDRLREELLREVRKREAAEEANVMEVPPRKIRRIQKELVPQKIIDITGEDDPDKPTVITILPGKDPYDQIDAEEDALEYMVGDETKSEIHRDDDAADDLSVITLDSYKDLDSERVREIWKGMAEVKERERDYYSQLADMVDEMTPSGICATVQVTPRLGTALPQCAEDLLEELGNEETFRRVLAVGYMAWERFKGDGTKGAEVPCRPGAIRDVAGGFLTTTSRVGDIQRGGAVARGRTRLNRMVGAERGEEGRKLQRDRPGRAPPGGRGKRSPPTATVSTLPPAAE